MTYLRLIGFMCASLSLFACSSDSISEQFVSKLRSCDLITSGRVNAFEGEPPDAEERCFAKCVIGGSCTEIDAFLCDSSDALEIRCAERCYGPDPGDFVCGDGETIPASWQCDGDDDCTDASDEAGCPTFTCSDGSTVAQSDRCDFFDDCEDGSDEAGCSNGFRCGDGSRVPDFFECDGEPDCEDGSDEVGCPTFRCGDGTTVPADYQCDFEADCEDGSDEAGCAQLTLSCTP